MNKNIQKTMKKMENLRLPELQARYAEIVGETSLCPNKKFLLRRIQEALVARENSEKTRSPSPEPQVEEPIVVVGMVVPEASAAPSPPREDEAESRPTTNSDAATAEVAASDETREAAPAAPRVPDVVLEQPVASSTPPVALGSDLASPPPPEVLPDLQPATAVASAALAAVQPEAASAPAQRIDGAPATRAAIESLGETTTSSSAAAETAPRQRGRFAGMSVEDLQANYLQVVGRPTGSRDPRYLQWKIREAEKGRVPVGAKSSSAEGADMKTLPLRLDSVAIEQMDQAWRARGIKSRTEFFRRAAGHYLSHLGAAEAAAAFGFGAVQS